MRSGRPLSDGVSTFWHGWQWVSSKIFKNLHYLFHLFYFYFFQDREFWRISRNCSRNQPPQKYSISPWVFRFCQIIFWKRQKSSHHLCRIFTIPTWLPRRVCSGLYISWYYKGNLKNETFIFLSFLTFQFIKGQKGSKDQ